MAPANNSEEPVRAAAPAQTFPLEGFGYRPVSNNMTLLAGYVPATVDFVDRDHILLTFSARKLLKRAEDQREEDQDHALRALVIHLPDGKVVREAEWRVHDHRSYLWRLPNGRFLLRIRGDLYTIHPLGPPSETMNQQLLLASHDRLVSMEFSPEHDLLHMETVPESKVGDDPSELKKDPVITSLFYSMYTEPNGTIKLTHRGRVVSQSPFAIAFSSLGLVETVREDRTHWGFDFVPFEGKKMELAGLMSTCRPHSIFVADADFFAFGCRGGDDRRLMAGFNLLGEAKWVFTTDDPPLWLAVSTAGETGRFAVRNTLLTQPGTANETAELVTEDIRAQEVRVFGDRDGEELLRVTVAPAQRPEGNFALSPDGLHLVTLHDTLLEVYDLPALSAGERKQHQRELEALAPLHGQPGGSDVAAALVRSQKKDE